jgi:hypothetical protein
MCDQQVPIERKEYGYFSQKQLCVVGSCYYHTPDGRLVEVTEVSTDAHMHEKDPEMTFVGEVTRYNSKKLYGFFSAEQCKLYGSLFYLTPDGYRVEVSEVSTMPTPWSLFTDVVYVGEVVGFSVGLASKGKSEETEEMKKIIEELEELAFSNPQTLLIKEQGRM